ncbi:MAG: type III polyketide synthase [Halobacteriovoraceae bacterium]|nr:type III polyketide synthase [Halobacteriovoraceae bacterium]
MSLILNSHSVFPEHEYDQNYFIDMLVTKWPDKKDAILAFAKGVCVEKRSLCLPLQEIVQLSSFSQRNALWKEKAFELAQKSIAKVFEDTELSLSDINLFITTSVTGFSIPSLDTLLMNKMDFSPNTKRLPLFGFGCLGGVASLNRAHDYLQSHPKDVVLVNAVELCSLTFQQEDLSVANLVGTSLFGDGAASVIMLGKEHPLAHKAHYEICDYGAFFYKNSEDMMGWKIKDSGFKLILNKKVPQIVQENIPQNLKQLLDKNELKNNDIQFSICHPGGPKVLLAIQEALGLDKQHFNESWNSLREHGNLSSVSVLNVLERSIKKQVGRSGEYGLMAAMGPGFNSEISLIKSCQ